MDEQLLEELINMGFSHNRAVRALHATGSAGVESAVNWVVDQGEDATLDTPLLVPKVCRVWGEGVVCSTHDAYLSLSSTYCVLVIHSWCPCIHRTTVYIPHLYALHCTLHIYTYSQSKARRLTPEEAKAKAAELLAAAKAKREVGGV